MKIAFRLKILSFCVLVLSCNKPQPTCFDGIKNGSETDIDCGPECLDCDKYSPNLGPCHTNTLIDQIQDSNNEKISLPGLHYGYSSGLFYVVAYSSNQSGTDYDLFITFNPNYTTFPNLDTVLSIVNYPPVNANEVSVKIYRNAMGYDIVTGGNLYIDHFSNGNFYECCGINTGPFSFSACFRDFN